MDNLTGLDYTNAIKLKFERFQAENARLKSQLAEAMELIETFKSEIELTQSCKLCLNNDENCIEGCRNKSKWKWQHQDRYEKLKGEAKPNEIPFTY